MQPLSRHTALVLLAVLALPVLLFVAACGGGRRVAAASPGPAMLSPAAEAPVIEWQRRAPGVAGAGGAGGAGGVAGSGGERVSLSLGGLWRGAPGGSRAHFLYPRRSLAADLWLFDHTFAPFQAAGAAGVPNAGALVFHGHGSRPASAAERRMIGEWTRLAVIESGADGAPVPFGLALAWHRAAATGGSCDELTVYLNGETRTAACGASLAGGAAGAAGANPTAAEGANAGDAATAGDLAGANAAAGPGSPGSPANPGSPGSPAIGAPASGATPAAGAGVTGAAAPAPRDPAEVREGRERRGRLEGENLARLYAWVDELASFQSAGGQDVQADALLDRLVFAGHGHRAASPQDIAAIEAFAAGLYHGLSGKPQSAAAAGSDGGATGAKGAKGAGTPQGAKSAGGTPGRPRPAAGSDPAAPAATAPPVPKPAKPPMPPVPTGAPDPAGNGLPRG